MSNNLNIRMQLPTACASYLCSPGMASTKPSDKPGKDASPIAR